MHTHLFILNYVISDVIGPVKKTPIDLATMNVKQMIDLEELETVLKFFFEAEIIDDMLALVFEANEIRTFLVKKNKWIDWDKNRLK